MESIVVHIVEKAGGQEGDEGGMEAQEDQH